MDGCCPQRWSIHDRHGGLGFADEFRRQEHRAELCRDGRCLHHARATAAARIEITEEANDRYFREVLARRGGQVFWQDSCATANRYYFDNHGDVPLRPASTLEAAWRSGHFPLEDYVFS